MPTVLFLFSLLVVSAKSQDIVDSLLIQVSDEDDAGMIFAGSVSIKVNLKTVLVRFSLPITGYSIISLLYDK